jgi:outer membrane protein, multidrug efflux system
LGSRLLLSTRNPTIDAPANHRSDRKRCCTVAQQSVQEGRARFAGGPLNLFGGGTSAWTFAPSITQAIFDGGSRQASLDVVRVEKDTAVAQYVKTIQTAFREVADGLAARGTYDDQIAALERDVAAQRSSLELSELRFHTGVDSYLAVLTAQTNLYSAEQTLVTARLARLTNLVDLYQALGGGWIERNGEVPRPAEDLALRQLSR